MNKDSLNLVGYCRVSTVDQTPDYLDENGVISNDILSESLQQLGSRSVHGSFGGGSDGTVPQPIGDGMYDSISNTNMQGYNLGPAGQGKTAYQDAIKILKYKISF